MKKSIASFLALCILAVSLGGCGANNTQGTSSPPPPVSSGGAVSTICPRYMTMMVLDRCLTTDRSWVMNRYVRFNCSCKSCMRLSTCAWMETSSAETGSDRRCSRRVRMREVHPGARHPPPARAHRGAGILPRGGYPHLPQKTDEKAAFPYADHLPGPVLLPQPTHDRQPGNC